MPGRPRRQYRRAGAYFETEELWFPEWDHMGTPWDNPQSYEKQQPGEFRQELEDPHARRPRRPGFPDCGVQGLGTFNALQRRGIPSQLLYFPDENHWVLKPANSILCTKRSSAGSTAAEVREVSARFRFGAGSMRIRILVGMGLPLRGQDLVPAAVRPIARYFLPLGAFM